MKKIFITASKTFILLGVLSMYAMQIAVLLPLRFALRGESGTDIGGGFVLGIVFSFFFVLDVVGAVILHIAFKKSEIYRMDVSAD